MNLLENSGSHGNLPVLADMKVARVKREVVMPCTPKNYQKVSAKFNGLVSIEREPMELFVNTKSNSPKAL
jgi:hypothetical protein